MAGLPFLYVGYGTWQQDRGERTDLRSDRPKPGQLSGGKYNKKIPNSEKISTEMPSRPGKGEFLCMNKIFLGKLLTSTKQKYTL